MKNPYRFILAKLEGLHESRRYLLSGVRRGKAEGVQGECGCLFGTVAPPSVREGDRMERYARDTYAVRPFAHWAYEHFGEAAAGLVADLEGRNDRYEPLINDAPTCAARYRYMVDTLRRLGDDWDLDHATPGSASEKENIG